ncbi:MAG: hypothetical protein M3238_05185, partial [Actinomycetota bacterium]|nr:hypothetical protein [Actinomycetota bacterium]
MGRGMSLCVATALVLTGSTTPASGGQVRCHGLEATIVGTNGDDILRGTRGDDVIAGRAGDDLLFGRGGNDIICGGRGGFDSLYGGDGADRMRGGPGSDEIDGGDGSDDVRGGSANDGLHGGPGNDQLYGGKGSFNHFVTGPGDDVMVGGPGTGDFLDFFPSPTAVRVDLADGTATGNGSDQISNIEVVFGSAFDDTLIGDGLPNELVGRSGNDTLISGGGGSLEGCSRPLQGAPEFACSDALDGEEGDDSLIGGDGFDTAWFNDTQADVDVDLVAGTASGDGTDSLTDIEGIHSPYGYDMSFVGDGNDNAIALGAGDDQIDAAGGRDRVLFISVEGVSVDLAAGEATGAGVDVLNGIEDVSGTNEVDFINGNGGPNRIDGRGGDDQLFGREGDDQLIGGRGRDGLDGGDGIDL